MSPRSASAARKRVGVLRDARIERALSSLPVLVDRFADVDRLIQQGRQLQPRICILGKDEGLEEVARLTRKLRSNLPFTDVIVWNPAASPALVQEALRAGVRQVVLEGEDAALADAVSATLEEQTLLPAMLEREQREGGTWRFEGLVSRSSKMWDIFETCIRTAETDASVLILGETGTGKDLIARAIHRRSKRKGRYVALNCGAVPDTLIDSELFGHVRGAFSGADQAKEGLFRYADGGTLFLDEIGNIPVGAQNRLLRVLQSQEVRPVGGHEEMPVDVRVIAATSASLEEEIDAGRFREDLFYRLDVIRLVVPPLRERPEDIIFLFGMFAQQLAQDYQLPRPEIGEGFLDAIVAHPWPGNVRELENFAERLILSHAGERLDASHFEDLQRSLPSGGAPRARRGATDGEADEGGAIALQGVPVDLDRTLPDVLEDATRDVEHAYLVALMQACAGRVGRAAERAGIHRRTLLRKLKRHGIDKAEFREAGRASLPAVLLLAALLALCAVWLPPLAAQQPGEPNEPAETPPEASADEDLPDEAVVQQVEQRARALDTELTALFDAVEGFEGIRVDVDAGVVHLRGTVPDETAAAQAVALAESHEAVALVLDKLEVDRSLVRRLDRTFVTLGERALDFVAFLPLLLVGLLIVGVFAWLGGRVRRAEGAFRWLGERALLRNLVRQLAATGVVFLGVVAALGFLGAGTVLGTLLGAAGVVGLAVGFAFRDIIENFLAGILLALRQPFRARDVVEIEGATGTVIRMTGSETVLMDFDGNHVRLPNATVFKGRVINYTRNPQRRFRVAVGVAVEDDLVAAREIGLDVLRRMKGVVGDPPPICRIATRTDSDVELNFFGWVDQGAVDYGKVASEAVRLIKQAFQRAGVLAPLPSYRLYESTIDTAEPPADAPSDSGPSPEDIDVTPDAARSEQIEEEIAQSEENLLEDAPPSA